jgi:hypothetical protein
MTMKPKSSLFATGICLTAVTATFGQPIITNQPSPRAAAPGTTVTFNVGASGTGPLAYQWQRNVGTGFCDLPGRTNAVLTLTNVQSWDAWDYRAVVTNLTGARTSAPAHLYVMSFAAPSGKVLLDNFDDNTLTGWSTVGVTGSGVLIESNQQLIVRGYWPGQHTTNTDYTYCLGATSTSYRTIPGGQTVEWRVDLVHLDDDATNAVKFCVGTPSGVYGFFKWRDFILLDKAEAYPYNAFAFEKASIRNSNVVLAVALTRAKFNVILTARVLDRENPDRVLYERSVVDTPNADPMVTTAEIEAHSGMRLAFGPESSGTPYTYAAAIIGLFQYTDGGSPAATVTYDNFEVWTYRVPIAHYVDASSANPTPPYTNWATAARVIQDAVDATAAGDEIVVTNGLYGTGGRAVGTNLLVNRVAVDKPLTVRSVNGPEVTIIQGYQVPGTTNGDGAIRCVYLADGASLSGFTLTNGATRANGSYDDLRGGGAWCGGLMSTVVSKCVLVGNSAFSDGGGAYGGTLDNCALRGNSANSIGGGCAFGTLNNCTLTGNSAGQGGGASEGTLNNCTLTGNSAADGGGAAMTTLNNCAFTRNSADWNGGGAFWGTLSNCTLTGNSAYNLGGGVAFGTLDNCTLTGNSAGVEGGGASATGIGWGYCTLNNCTLTGNSAGVEGGGAAFGTLNNCTLTGNSAGYGGGGVAGGTLNNCIVYYNTATNGPNNLGSTLLYCCTTPLPAGGVGNIFIAPLFVDYAGGNLRLQTNSPCINAGFNAYAPSPTDLDGLPRIVRGTVDIGAYECQGPGSVISYAWLQHYGLATDGSADFADPDREGLNTWQEWRCQTDPTNALSVLRLLSASPAGTNVMVTWQSVTGVNYFVERATNLAADSPFTLVATNLLGKPGTTSYTDTNGASLTPIFYRVGVMAP